MKRISQWLVVVLLASLLPPAGADAAVRVKDLGRVEGVRDNLLVGHGLVVGLAGTGDSVRSRSTLQAITNTLTEFGIKIDPAQLASRNAAAVIVTATLPPYVRPGDKLEVSVSSLSDARSLSGGTLMMAPLYGPNRKLYALAQGPVSVGGYSYELNGNMVQKNHPTSGMIPQGAIVEHEVDSEVVDRAGMVDVLLAEPDFTTASRIAHQINAEFNADLSRAVDAQRIEIKVPDMERRQIVDFVARIENVQVAADTRARVVVNERTGTVVSGGDVTLSKITIAHGDLNVAIATDYQVSQPALLVEPGPGVRTAIVPSTDIRATEAGAANVSLPEGATVADLVSALNKIKTSTQGVIAILQAIKRAGALHAELVIQ